jgi:hypothetical protein
MLMLLRAAISVVTLTGVAGSAIKYSRRSQVMPFLGSAPGFSEDVYPAPLQWLPVRVLAARRRRRFRSHPIAAREAVRLELPHAQSPFWMLRWCLRGTTVFPVSAIGQKKAAQRMACTMRSPTG